MLSRPTRDCPFGHPIVVVQLLVRAQPTPKFLEAPNRNATNLSPRRASDRDRFPDIVKADLAARFIRIGTPRIGLPPTKRGYATQTGCADYHSVGHPGRVPDLRPARISCLLPPNSLGKIKRSHNDRAKQEGLRENPPAIRSTFTSSASGMGILPLPALRSRSEPGRCKSRRTS